MPKKILLTGAGFSHNWGGFLANEAFEYLLGSSCVDDLLRIHLWRQRERGSGFEDVLAHFQAAYEAKFDAKIERDLRNLTTAIRTMFAEMAIAYGPTHFQAPSSLPRPEGTTIASLLDAFDAIYTLNQDNLIEQKYQGNLGRFVACTSPGLRPAGIASEISGGLFPLQTPAPEPFSVPMGHQPYVKLHGSFDWLVDERDTLLILGGNKAENIKKYPLLSWYHRLFKSDLESPDTRLMVIGYSFSDSHINNAIAQAAASNNNLKIFIVDPLGTDVLDKRDKSAPIPQPRWEAELLEALAPRVIGASRRPLRSTFGGGDFVENQKVWRFLHVPF